MCMYIYPTYVEYVIGRTKLIHTYFNSLAGPAGMTMWPDKVAPLEFSKPISALSP